jgi:ubiquinone/menaquinone biosynthesis C-methylase UbiE
MSSSIRFDNGAAYERYMGRWSQLAGEAFLEWLALPTGLRWLDVGCGNGAFTELMAARSAPSAIAGIDPSEGMLAFARARPRLAGADLRAGDAMALPFADHSFDVAVMPLVIFFVPDPAKGVAEMARVLRAGGTAAAYAWDMDGGGFPYDVVRRELQALGAVVPDAPSVDASRLKVMRALWRQAGFEHVETRAIVVQRAYADFEDYWTTIQGGPSVSGTIGALSSADRERLKAGLRECLPADAGGRIVCQARANAIRGRVRS